MRKQVCLAALMGGLCAEAHTLAETNEVVKFYNIMIQWEGRAVMDTLDMDKVYPSILPVMRSYEELFEYYPTNEVGGTWTAQERQNVFEGVLWSIPDLPTNSYVQGGVFFSNWMLKYCLRHDQTNCLPLAERILLSPHKDCFYTARMMFEKFARPSEETYRFVEFMMTNRMETFMTEDQSRFLDSFGDVLLNHRDDTSPDIISNGVRLIRRSIERMDGWNGFDYVMRKLYPDYAMSSNRLAFAITALDAEPSPGEYGHVLANDVRGLFIPITNTLLNASEPLKVLDLSWLDEQPTDNTNETEQQEEINE